MKITGTRSYIKIEIEIDGRTIKIPGEMIVGGFVAYKEGIKKWE
ncbi:Imm74 family immunity protein [Serratia proteamaculans]